jgi:hypothetical protein
LHEVGVRDIELGDTSERLTGPRTTAARQREELQSLRREESYSQSGFDSTVLVAEAAVTSAAAPVDWDAFWKRIELTTETALTDRSVEVVVGGAAAVTTVFSVGYVISTIRGSILVASLASSLPTWSLLDPLPVLDRRTVSHRESNEQPREESLHEMLDRSNKGPQGEADD